MLQGNNDTILTFILDHSRRELVYENDERTHIMLKVAYNEGIDFLYTQYQYREKSPLRIGEDLQYAGFVDSITGRLYDSGYRLFGNPCVDPSIPLTDVKNEVEEAVTAAIVELVGDSPVDVTAGAEPWRNDRDHFEAYGARREARKAFFNGVKRIRYKPCIFIDLSTEETIAIVMDMDGFVKRWADAYVLRSANRINERLWEIGLAQQALDRLIITQGAHHTTLAIAASVAEEMKTVNIHLDKEGQQFSIKMSASILRCADVDDYSTYHMDSPSRRAFEKAFGRQAKLLPSDIQRITYGKQTLYQSLPL